MTGNGPPQSMLSSSQPGGTSSMTVYVPAASGPESFCSSSASENAGP